jgi:hypothetical protein
MKEPKIYKLTNSKEVRIGDPDGEFIYAYYIGKPSKKQILKICKECDDEDRIYSAECLVADYKEPKKCHYFTGGNLELTEIEIIEGKGEENYG